MIEDDVVGRVLRLPDLLQDDRALAAELAVVQRRVLQDVGDDVDRERHVLLQHLGVVGRVLARGIGVQMAADRLDLLGDRPGVAAPRALEHHVLEEVGHAVDRRRFVAAAGLDPDADRSRLDRIHRVGRDPQAVRQGRDADAHYAFTPLASIVSAIAARSRPASAGST